MNPFRFISILRRKLFNSSNFVRAHERLSCAVPGNVLFVERGCHIEGVVDEISRGGIRLRPAKSYILKRMGENIAVRVSFHDLVMDAILVNTSAHGYGVKFNQLLEHDEVERIVALG